MKALINSIIFEGITGSGKSTQIKKILLSEIRPRFVVYDNTSPIYDTTTDARATIRSVNNPAIPEAFMHLFTNWMKLYENESRGKLAIIDRFTLSNLVYFIARCEMDKIPIDLCKTREMFLIPFGLSVLTETNTIYFDCDPVIAQHRTLLRNNRAYFNLELQKRARDIYLRELNTYPYRNISVDASEDPEKTYSQVHPILEAIVEDKNNGKI